MLTFGGDRQHTQRQAELKATGCSSWMTHGLARHLAAELFLHDLDQ